MDFSCELCKLYQVSPFEIMKQDKDEIIMLINYYIEKGQSESQSDTAAGDKFPTEKENDNGAFWSLL